MKNTAVHSKNLVKYIATREGVVCNKDSFKKDLLRKEVSEKQQALINEVVNKFPMINELDEYQNFLKYSSKENASKFLTEAFNLIEDQQVKKEIYLKYISERPRVEKLKTHGLFNSGGEADLQKEIKNISEHKGVVWTHIISLKREDAKRLGYDNLNDWQLLLKTKIPKIAEAMNIKLDNLVWNAAFHNEGNHPHIHLVIYSKNPKEGYLKEEGIKKIKSVLMNEIFKEELLKIKNDKTLKRDEIKTEFQKEIDKAYQNVITKNFKVEDKLINQFIELAKILPEKGRCVYGYQSKEVKQKVDEIVKGIMQNKNMKLLYEQYQNYNKELAAYYSGNEVKSKDVAENKEFRKLQNIVLKSAGILPKDINFQSKIFEDKLKSLDKEIKAIKEQHMNKVQEFKLPDSRKIKKENFIEERDEILQRKDESLKSISDKFANVMDEHLQNDEKFKNITDTISLRSDKDPLELIKSNIEVPLKTLLTTKELKQDYDNYIAACKDYDILISSKGNNIKNYEIKDFKSLSQDLAFNILLHKKFETKNDIENNKKSIDDKLKNLDNEMTSIKEYHKKKDDYKFPDSRKIKRENFIEESKEILQRKDESVKNITDKFTSIMDKHFESDDKFKKLVDTIHLKPNTYSLDIPKIDTDLLLQNLFKTDDLKSDYAKYTAACKDYNVLLNKPKNFSHDTHDFKNLEQELSTNVLLYKKQAEKDAFKVRAESMKNIEDKLLANMDKYYVKNEKFKQAVDDIHGSFDRALDAAEILFTSEELLKDYSTYLKASEDLNKLYGIEYSKEDYKTEFNNICHEFVDYSDFISNPERKNIFQSILDGGDNLKRQYDLNRHVDVKYGDYAASDREAINYMVKGVVFDIANDLYFAAVENEVQHNKIVMRNRQINRNKKKYNMHNGISY